MVEIFAPPATAITGRSGFSERGFQCFEFGLQRAAGERRHFMREPLGRGMRAVRGRESVVHVNIAVFRECCHEIRIVLFLAFMKAGIFEQQNLSRLQNRNGLGGVVADAIGREQHNLVERLREHGHESASSDSDLSTPLGRPKCESKITFAPLSESSRMVGKHALDAGRVGDAAIFHRHVEIDADENAFVVYVGLIECAEGGHLKSYASFASVPVTSPSRASTRGRAR